MFAHSGLPQVGQRRCFGSLFDDFAFFNEAEYAFATDLPVFFVLSMKNAKIYDLDDYPVSIKPWTELPNVRAYYELFKEHETEFED